MATLHAALVTPLTGPLGLYGKAGATALTLWAKKAAHLPAHFTEVELAVHDTGDDLHVVKFPLRNTTMMKNSFVEFFIQ